MWVYEKKLQYPVKIICKDLRMAKFLLTQYGGPDGELSAAIGYLNQRYSMPNEKGKAILTDIGTEELAHVEIICSMVHQLLKGASPQELIDAGLGAHYAMHDSAVYPSDAAGVPWTAAYTQAHGDPIADLHNDLAAEQKARATYEHLMRLTDDPDVIEPLRFLRQREVIHFQRFGEVLDDVQFLKSSKKYY